MKYANSMKEFYKEHNISAAKLATLAGVNPNFMSAYTANVLKDKEAKLRLDIAADVIEDYGMIFPNEREQSYQKVREPEEYDKYFHRIYDQILLAEL